MARISISLPDHLQAFVEAEIASRGYESASEYILLLVQQAQVQHHRAPIEKLLLEGLESGTPSSMTKDDWTGIRAEVDKRKAARSRIRKPKRA